MQGRFAENPAYVEYESLLRRLHVLGARGDNDSEEADALREAMDGPERQLNRREMNRLNGLSADLYMLNGEEVLEQPPAADSPAALRELIEEYERWNDWDSVLALLRRRPSTVPAEAVAFTRARAYAALGHHETALLFFEHAMSHRAVSSDYRALHLLMLKKAGRDQEAIRLGAEYASSQDPGPAELISNAVNRFELLGSADVSTVLNLLSNALHAVGPRHPAPVSYVVLAYILAARCLLLLDQPGDAVAALDEALKLRPQDVAIQEAREIASAAKREEASESFTRAAENLMSAVYAGKGRSITTARADWGKAA